MSNAYFRAAARLWLEGEGRALHSGGWVIFWAGRVAGWSECPNPRHWRAGAVFVCLGSDFPVMVAVGGDDCHGADRWEVRRD